MRLALAALALLLAGCDDIHHMLATHPRPHPHRVHARPPAEAAAPVEPETHEQLVARKRTEADARRRDWCDAHPGLTVRTGCESRR